MSSIGVIAERRRGAGSLGRMPRGEPPHGGFDRGDPARPIRDRAQRNSRAHDDAALQLDRGCAHHLRDRLRTPRADLAPREAHAGARRREVRRDDELVGR